MDNEHHFEPYYCDVFAYLDGYLYCENVLVVKIIEFLRDRNVPLPHSPCFVYSKAKLTSNVDSYMQPLKQLKRKSSLNYAVKANMNVSILKLLNDLGCSYTLVSGHELRLCLELGFDPECMVLNGNGKQDWEIEMAVNCGCLLNIDSFFNLSRTRHVCRILDKRARVLLRVNPDIDPNVHKYVATGTIGSKFGVEVDRLDEILAVIKSDPNILLVGLHCHLGSTITKVDVFRDSAIVMSKLYNNLKKDGHADMTMINIGGGLGISSTIHASRTSASDVEPSPNVERIPKPSEIINAIEEVFADDDITLVLEPGRSLIGNAAILLTKASRTSASDVEPSPNVERIPKPSEIINAIEEVFADDDITLVLEPGRSLIGNAAILLTKVLGVKEAGPKNYIVVDSSMTEIIRPALYQAYHHIDLAEPVQCIGDKQVFQIVGPVCESGDFLGKDRLLPTPYEGDYMAVFDVGAYCSSMASTYNMRPRPAEVLIDKTECRLIRRPDTFESMLEPYLV